MADSVMAYHFVGPTLRDGRPVPPDGEWLRHDGPIEWCHSGLYASRHPSDALAYARDETLCIVECREIVRDDDGKASGGAPKFVCRERRIVKRIDATELLREHARWCALRVGHLWDMPPVVRQYLETGDESKRTAAKDEAWAAARAAAGAAGWAAAGASALAAAGAAEWAAAGAAEWAAAGASALAAAWDAERQAQRDHLLGLVAAHFGEA